MTDPRTLAVAYRLDENGPLWVAVVDLVDVNLSGSLDARSIAQDVWQEVLEPSEAFTVDRPPLPVPLFIDANTVWRGLTAEEKLSSNAKLRVDGLAQ